MVRTRIAPSPTGFPHIGTVYQALFDFAFARRHDGQFIVRIEDTDQARFVERAEEKILEALDWFGLTEDESPRKEGTYGPYRQSERLDIYKKYVHELIEKGHAYYCFCTKERLTEIRAQMQKEKKIPRYDRHCRTLDPQQVQQRVDAGESYVVRMKIPDNETIVVPDGLRGEVKFQSAIIDDQVILKSDGFPTYHLAVVVDDHLMQVTHVLRGEEWLSSAPKHILLYRYFGWEAPQFFHTPLIRNPDKSKFSKRQGHTNVSWYQQEGYVPEAILNYLALMGWTHPQQKELFDLHEFISLFDFKDLKPLGPIFDLKKLQWMNGQYIMRMKEEVLKKKIVAFYADKHLDETIVEQSVPLIKERIKTLKDYYDIAGFLFEAPTTYEKDPAEHRQLVQAMIDRMQSVQPWQADVIGEAMQRLATEKEIKFGIFFMVLRVALSGKKITPPLNESMELLGKEECVRRLQSLA
ncbi:glutamate--tRNA ligase [Candidatus Woesebacteria bacterium]|nr:glutamate--tRNA ligase [Candidatus Woesebacteria bacterium]